MIANQTSKRRWTNDLPTNMEGIFIATVVLCLVAILMAVQVSKLEEQLDSAQVLGEELRQEYIVRQTVVQSYVEKHATADTYKMRE